MGRRLVVFGVGVIASLVLPGAVGAGEAPSGTFGLEFLDVGGGSGPAPGFVFGARNHVVVTSEGESVPSRLPIVVTGHAGGRQVFQVTIPADGRHCGGPGACSTDLPIVADPGDGSIVIDARTEAGDLLARHVQGDAEAAMGRRADDDTASGDDTGDATEREARGDGDGGGGDLFAILLGSIAALGLAILAFTVIQRLRQGDQGGPGGGDGEGPGVRGSGSEMYTTTTDAERGELEVARDRLREEIDTEWRTDLERSRLQQQLDQVEKELDEVKERQRRERRGPFAPDDADFSPPGPDDSGPTYRG